jgi:hypothetical protein
MWEQNPETYERPANEMIAAVCDLFAGILEGLRENAGQIAAQFGMLSVVPMAIRNSSSRVKQSGFWLMAIAARHCNALVLPLLPEVIPLCAAGLGPTMSFTVSTNACIAIGDVCEHAQPETLTPYLGAIIPALIQTLQRRDEHVPNWQMRGYNQLLRSGCTALNRLRQKSALGQQWGAVCAQFPADVGGKLQKRYGLIA